MDDHRKMAEEIANKFSHLFAITGSEKYSLWYRLVDEIENALRSTASKSEKDGYDRGRKDGRLLLEKIGKPLRRFDLTPGRTVEVSMDNINKLASAIVQALAIIETGKTLLVSTLSLSAKNSEK